MRSYLALLVLICSLGITAFIGSRKVAAAGDYTYFPSASTIDGRFLSIASDGLATMAGNKVTIGFAAGSTVSEFEIGIFDGDTSASWDRGTTPLTFTLYADPQERRHHAGQ
jgi:hypothetical protein